MARPIDRCTFTPTVFLPQSSSAQSLIDHGVNGGIGGSDVSIIHKTHHSIDGHSIDNYQMVDIPIATVGDAINTQQHL